MALKNPRNLRRLLRRYLGESPLGITDRVPGDRTMRLTCPQCSRAFDSEGLTVCPECAGPADATAVYDPDATGQIGAGVDGAPARVGDYRLLRRLGAGGMGAVYEAEQLATGCRVALKLIRSEYASSRDA